MRGFESHRQRAVENFIVSTSLNIIPPDRRFPAVYPLCIIGLVAEHQPSKLRARVRFPYDAFCVYVAGTQDMLICQDHKCQWKRWHHGDIAQLAEQMAKNHQVRRFKSCCRCFSRFPQLRRLLFGVGDYT